MNFVQNRVLKDNFMKYEKDYLRHKRRSAHPGSDSLEKRKTGFHENAQKNMAYLMYNCKFIFGVKREKFMPVSYNAYENPS